MEPLEERVEWISEAARLVELRERWDALAGGRFAPFLRLAWFERWWEAFHDGRRLCVCALWRREELAAVMPLCVSGRARLEAMANVHSPVWVPLGADAAALRRVLVVSLRGGGELVVPGVPPGDPLTALLAAAEEARRLPLVERWHAAPVTDTGGDFAAYREQMKGGWREIERRRRKLLREHEVSVEPIAVPGTFEAELEEGIELEASGWKGAARTAILNSPDTARFYRTVARTLHDTGELRLSRLRIDGRLAAFDFAVLHEGRYFLLKTAFSEELRRFAPGLVLRLAVIERCFELGLDAHEFLGDDMQWKRLFATGRQDQRLFRAYARRPLPVLRRTYRSSVRAPLRWAYRRTLGRRNA